MCGIAGIFIRSGEAAVSERMLTLMRDSMRHRGPDGGANWIDKRARIGLAHRRLSIIDLSAAASQPMANEDGTVMVVFNGEIWNHLSLRKELLSRGHRFITDHSDTEVIVHGYEEWGIDGLLRRLDGDLAIGIWDSQERELCLVRDRIGIKPLYFSFTGSSFLFASEIKAILQHPDIVRDIEPAAISHYLSFLVTPAPLTLFKGIFKLPAGFYLRIRETEFQAVRYWDAIPGAGIPPSEIAGLSENALEDFYVQGISDRLRRAVEKRMMSDVPFGVFLSGGVDSSTNVALMQQMMTRPVDTFTVGFKDHQHLNELEHADLIAKKFKTNHHQILIDERDMTDFLDSLIYHQDEPLADWVCIPLYFVSRLAKNNGVTVVQVGEGSDEQFCGYASYMGYLRLYHRYWSPFRKYLPLSLQSTVAWGAGQVATWRPSLEVYADIVDRAARNREHFWSGAMAFWDIPKKKLVSLPAFPNTDFPREMLESHLLPQAYLCTDSFSVIASFLRPFDKAFPTADPLTRMIYNEFKLRLPELLLMRVDKMTMATSVEARVPFLCHELVEFTMDIPERWKTKNREAKYLLKKAVELLIPHDIIYRKKMGFGAPMSQWLRGAFGDRVHTELKHSALLRRGFLNPEYINWLSVSHKNGTRDNALYLWVIYNLARWYDFWIEGRN